MIKQVVRGVVAGAVLAAALVGVSTVPAMAASCADRGYSCIEYYAEPTVFFKTKAEARSKFPSVQARCRRDHGTVIRSDVYKSGDEYQTVVLCRLKV